MCDLHNKCLVGKEERCRLDNCLKFFINFLINGENALLDVCISAHFDEVYGMTRPELVGPNRKKIYWSPKFRAFAHSKPQQWFCKTTSIGGLFHLNCKKCKCEPTLRTLELSHIPVLGHSWLLYHNCNEDWGKGFEVNTFLSRSAASFAAYDLIHRLLSCRPLWCFKVPTYSNWRKCTYS